MIRIFFFGVMVSIFPFNAFAKKECYAINRDGQVIVFHDKDYDECMVETRKVRANIGSDKSILTVGWGDSSQVDAKVISAKKQPTGEKQLATVPCLKKIRAVPNIIPGSDGKIDGLRLVDLEKGSAWERSNLKIMDVIVSVNNREIKDGQNIESYFKVGANALKYRRGDSSVMSTSLECPAP